MNDGNEGQGGQGHATDEGGTPSGQPTAKNVGASVRARLLNLARSRGTDFDLVLNRYAVERLLFRLSRSRYADAFVLKGATLFTLWAQEEQEARATGENTVAHTSPAENPSAEMTWQRPTRDLDLLGSGDPNVAAVVAIFQEICVLEVADDGLSFAPATLHGETIREEEVYEGVRVRVRATLAGAQIPLQIDVGFGDALTPAARWVEFPTLLPAGAPGAAPRLRVYPRETVVAEKFEALVTLGLGNSRLKDFYDLWMLSRHFTWEPALLAEAVRATFARRGTPLPAELPLALTDTFAHDAVKTRQWEAFRARSDLAEAPLLPEVIAVLREFLWPVVQTARLP